MDTTSRHATSIAHNTLEWWTAKTEKIKRGRIFQQPALVDNCQ